MNSSVLARYYFGDKLGDKNYIFEQFHELKVSNKYYESGGIPFESDGEQQYISSGEEHTLVIAATGAGKTVSIVKPTVHNCIRAGENIVVVDPKGEIYEDAYSALYQYGYKIDIINFRNLLNGSAYNPLLQPYKYWKSSNPIKRDLAIKLLEDMRYSLFSTYTKNEDPFWPESAGDIFIGLTLALFETATSTDQISLSNVYSLLANGRKSCCGTLAIKRYFDEFIDHKSLAYSSFSSYIAAPNDTRGSMEAVFFQKMRMFYSSELLIDMLSNNDIDLNDLYNKKRALFIIVPDESRNYHSLVSIIITQIYQKLIKIAQNDFGGKLPYRVNFILEEFGNLTINNAPSMLSAARSRNIRFVLILQTEKQLKSIYGENDAQTIKTNCMNWVYLYSRELSFLRELSELIGEKIFRINDSTFKTPLLSVSKLQALDVGKAVVFLGRNKAIVTNLAPIWKYNYNLPNRKAKYPVRELKKVNYFDVNKYLSNQYAQKARKESITIHESNCKITDIIEANDESL